MAFNKYVNYHNYGYDNNKIKASQQCGIVWITCFPCADNQFRFIGDCKVPVGVTLECE